MNSQSVCNSVKTVSSNSYAYAKSNVRTRIYTRVASIKNERRLSGEREKEEFRGYEKVVLWCLHMQSMSKEDKHSRIYKHWSNLILGLPTGCPFYGHSLVCAARSCSFFLFSSFLWLLSLSFFFTYFFFSSFYFSPYSTFFTLLRLQVSSSLYVFTLTNFVFTLLLPLLILL